MRPVSYLSTDDRIHSSTIWATIHPLEVAYPRCILFPPQNNTVRSLARLVSMVLYIKKKGVTSNKGNVELKFESRLHISLAMWNAASP